MRLAACLLLLVLGACAPDRHRVHMPRVTVPPWIAAHPELEAEARAEIDAAGVPEFWVVVIRLPKFDDERYAGGTQLLRGLCDDDARRIDVGFRFSECEDRPLLPALEHEVMHSITGDPCAGHDPLTCQ